MAGRGSLSLLMICGVQWQFKHKDPTWLSECVA